MDMEKRIDTNHGSGCLRARVAITLPLLAKLSAAISLALATQPPHTRFWLWFWTGRIELRPPKNRYYYPLLGKWAVTDRQTKKCAFDTTFMPSRDTSSCGIPVMNLVSFEMTSLTWTFLELHGCFCLTLPFFETATPSPANQLRTKDH